MSLATTSEQHSLAPSLPIARRVPNSGSFRTGASGNPGGRPRTAHIRKQLLSQLRQEIAAGVTNTGSVCAAVIDKAIAGDVAAFTAIRDTVDGKPGNDGAGAGTIAIAIGIEFIGQDK